MLRHSDIWTAIDSFARAHGLSPSGLARRAGLDSTTFNKSKRTSREGKLRWPSTESISKILAAMDCSFGDFLIYLGGDAAEGLAQRVPVIGFAEAGDQGFFDDAGYPTGCGWDETVFPKSRDPHAYALEISGDSMQPIYRDGDIVVVSPQANIRRGDRVVLKTKEGEVLAKELKRQSSKQIELLSLNRAYGDRIIPIENVEWMARIVWVSQ
ncbi:MAG: DNA-binding protein [Rhodospirillaceae bacterium]|nr:MAG: DNA-binding protein [Rhodospirillaceae bacterium]